MPKYLLTILPFLLFGLGAEAQIIIVPQPARTSNDLDLGGETPQANSLATLYGPTSQVQRDEAWQKYLQLNSGGISNSSNMGTAITPSANAYELGPLAGGNEPGQRNSSNLYYTDSPSTSEYENGLYRIEAGERIAVPNSYYPPSIGHLSSTPATHTVTKGETLYSISKQYNLSVGDIQDWNNLNSSMIRRGQVLNVAAPGTVANYEQVPRAVAFNDSGNMHIVQPGETVASLALKYGYTSSRYRDINDLGPNDYIRVGQRLKTTHCDCQSQTSFYGQGVVNTVSPNNYNTTAERMPTYYTSPDNYVKQSRRGFYQSVFLDATSRYQTNNGGPYFYYEADQSGLRNDLQELIYLTERSVNTARQSQYQAIFGGSSLANQRSENWTYAQNNLVNSKVAIQPLSVTDRSQLVTSYQKLYAYYQSLRDQQDQLQTYYSGSASYLNATDKELLAWLLGNGGQMLTSLEQSLSRIEALYATPILETNYTGMLSLIEDLKASGNSLAQIPSYAVAPANYQATALQGLELLLTNY